MQLQINKEFENLISPSEIESVSENFDEYMQIKPEYSKNQVKKAGEVLIGKENDMSEEEALAILNNWRSSHAYPLNIVQNSLRYQVKK